MGKSPLRAREEKARNLGRRLNANLLGVGITSVSVRCSSTNNQSDGLSVGMFVLIYKTTVEYLTGDLDKAIS
jgi:hypothetical protein